jgi:hypothetical protein
MFAPKVAGGHLISPNVLRRPADRISMAPLPRLDSDVAYDGETTERFAVQRRTHCAAMTGAKFLAAVATTLMSCGGATGTTAGTDAAPPALIAAGVMAPPSLDGTECFYTSDPTAPMLSHGTVDCALTQTYEPTVLVGNTGPQAEIQGAVVQVVDPATNAVVTDSMALGSASELAGSVPIPSYATVALTLMSSVAMSYFCPNDPTVADRTAEMEVTVYGQTLAGQPVRSNDLLFSVDVCYGCLVLAPASAPVGYCSGEYPMTSAAVACILGQDQVADCQTCTQIPYCKTLR